MDLRGMRRPSPAMVIALIALIASLGGTAMAAKGLISGSKIKKGTLPANRLKKNSITSRQVNEKKLGIVPRATIAETATNAQKAVHANSADSTSTAVETGSKRASATGGASVTAARAAAPQIALASKGPFSVYGKCFTDTSTSRTYIEFFIATSESGALFNSGDDDLTGGVDQFLNTDTIEDDRRIYQNYANASTSTYVSDSEGHFFAMAPSGAAVNGEIGGFVKNGTLGGAGDGMYGAGNVCLFTGTLYG